MKPREERLFIAFMLVLLLSGTALVWKQYHKRKTQILDRAHQLALEEEEISILLEQREKWLVRSRWLAEQQPAFTSRDRVDNQLLEQARSPGVPGVRTTGLKLKEPVETPDYIQAGIEFTARGKLSDVFAWIYQLQQPEAFRVVETLKVTPDKDEPSTVVCEVALVQWYAPESSPKLEN